MPVRLVILSESRLYREGLAAGLAKHSQIEAVEACGSAEEAVESARRAPHTVVLVDLGSVRDLVAVRRLGAAAPDATLLALAPHSDSEIVAATEAGMTGYVPPEASVEDLLAQVEHAARGELLCTPRVAGTLARRLATLAARVPGASGAPSLTTREREVLDLLNAGLSNKQIARRLSIRLATVKNHVHSILTKLNVRSREEARAAAHLRPEWGGDPLPDGSPGGRRRPSGP